jgi:hypothetical protein
VNPDPVRVALVMTRWQRLARGLTERPMPVAVSMQLAATEASARATEAKGVAEHDPEAVVRGRRPFPGANIPRSQRRRPDRYRSNTREGGTSTEAPGGAPGSLVDATTAAASPTARGGDCREKETMTEGEYSARAPAGAPPSAVGSETPTVGSPAEATAAATASLPVSIVTLKESEQEHQLGTHCSTSVDVTVNTAGETDASVHHPSRPSTTNMRDWTCPSSPPPGDFAELDHAGRRLGRAEGEDDDDGG